MREISITKTMITKAFDHDLVDGRTRGAPCDAL